MPIAHIEKHRVRRRESRSFGLGTWLDDAGIEAHADDDDWYMDPDDTYVGFGKLVWVGTREVWHGDLLTHVDEYEYERPERATPMKGDDWDWTWEDLEMPRGMRLNRFYVEGLTGADDAPEGGDE